MKRILIKHAAILFVVFSLLLNPVFATSAFALGAPDPIAPTDGAVTTVVDSAPLGIPEFQWTAVSGATSYRLQVSSDIAFTSPIVNITTPNVKYTPIAISFSDAVWYWRIRVEAPAPVSAYSNIRSFTKQWASPANFPALSSPADGAALDFYDQPVFSWGAVTGAAEYKLQIYSSPGGWSTLAYNAITLATTHQPSTK